MFATCTSKTVLTSKSNFDDDVIVNLSLVVWMAHGPKHQSDAVEQLASLQSPKMKAIGFMAPSTSAIINYFVVNSFPNKETLR